MSSQPNVIELVEGGELNKALKLCNTKIHKGINSNLFKTMKGYCLVKMKKPHEGLDLAVEVKVTKPTSPEICKYLALIYTETGNFSEATSILEDTYFMNPDNEDIGRDLFYSYVRENKLLKQQNHALMLYKQFEDEDYALWAVETMYLIKLSIKNFETKILDIAYLLLLKVMKHPDFEMDKKFVMLYLRVLKKQGNYKEALEFIESKNSFFTDKVERQQIEADLFLKSDNLLDSINIFFQILKSNSHIASFRPMWPTYQKCIRIILVDYIPKILNFEYKPSLDYSLNYSSITSKPFDPISEGIEPIELLETLLSSIMVLKKNIIADNPKTKAVANAFKRTLSLCEIEYKFCLALNCPAFPTQEKSTYYNSILNYLEAFFEHTDVVQDLRPYLKLFSSEDSFAFRDFFKEKIEKFEKYNLTSRSIIPDIKLVRWKACFFKLCKTLNLYGNLPDIKKRCEVVNEIFETYLQAMAQDPKHVTPVDKKNFEDIVVIAYILLKDSKIYDFSVLNPFNYYAIVMLEIARKNNPSNRDFNLILLELYDKLGCSSRLTDILAHFQTKGDDYEKLGYLKFSHLSEFGIAKGLEATCKQYKTFYDRTLIENKNRVITCFQNKEFEKISEFLDKNESMQGSYFMSCTHLTLLFMSLFKNGNNPHIISGVFSKDFQYLNSLCDDEESLFEEVEQPKPIQYQVFESIKIDQEKSEIRKQELGEKEETKEEKKNSYDLPERKINNNATPIHVFGSNHPKILKFMAIMIRCLRHCYESKPQELNLDLNKFLLLKNELSLNYLRQYENVFTAVKAAIKIYASQDEAKRKEIEKVEIATLEKIIKNQSSLNPFSLAGEKKAAEETKEEETEKKPSESAPKAYDPLTGKYTEEAAIFEKLIQKLVEYNEKVNDGKEITIVDYLRRIDSESKFMREFETQKVMKNSFIEEFKIHCYNYILLLFESIMRILTTLKKEKDDDSSSSEEEEEKKEDVSQKETIKGKKKKKGKKDVKEVFSKNYKRFLENRQKKIDKFIVNCIGWNHIHRCVEVLGMTARDLVYRIVPTKVVVRELKTTSGKVLKKDCKYTLVEKKRYVTVGKKTQVDYVYELDLKDENEEDEEEKEEKKTAHDDSKDEKENDQKNAIFFMNFDDFSIFKLKSIIYFLYYPLTFTEIIANLWLQIVPMNIIGKKAKRDDGTEDFLDSESISVTRQAMREFINSLINHLKSLQEYVNQVKEEKLIAERYKRISRRKEIATMKEICAMYTQKEPEEVEKSFATYYDNIIESQMQTVDNLNNIIEEKITRLKAINMR
ncbi:unnamed protein product [Moneuplotes crassus]|uniref:Uncharacterized protein n=2 Tax=Euplotes crassus TaxID=5936 RepID=A0AAD1UPX9_EUPCR|nr:unnamed protein product [Moneuplotes crassus]